MNEEQNARPCDDVTIRVLVDGRWVKVTRADYILFDFVGRRVTVERRR